MPFTFAHPAAAVPMLHPLGRYGVLSALVIGSLTPDLAYVLPVSVSRHESHTLAALLWFCLPVGVLSYLLFHLVLKGPLLGLLPLFALRRMGVYASTFRSLPAVPWSAVIVSLLCGASTHLLWDAFTHADAPAVAAFPLLQTHLFWLGAYPVYVYKVLQHGSTCLGLLLLSWWSWRSLDRASIHLVSLPITLSRSQRLLAVAVIAGLPAVVGLSAGVQALEASAGVVGLQAFAGRAVFSGLPVLALVVVAYSVGWHVWRLREHVAG